MITPEKLGIIGVFVIASGFGIAIIGFMWRIILIGWKL